MFFLSLNGKASQQQKRKKTTKPALTVINPDVVN